VPSLNSSEEVTFWAILGDWFFYQPSPGDDESDHFFLVNLKRKNATLKIVDFLKDTSCNHNLINLLLDRYIAFYDDYFYCANDDHIKVVKVDHSAEEGEHKTVEVQSHLVSHVETGLKIHGLIQQSDKIIVACETADAQLDFN